jgi:glyoxylase-like metal-dependent hydrolase (beta-lactamase superfamily II)
MKQLHRPDLFSWSQFDTARNVDFHGYLWVRPAAGSVAFDPMPLTDHDQRHIESLGGVAWVYLSNADHVRAAAWFRDHFHARIAAPAGDRHLPEFAGLAVDLWLEPGVTLDDGVRCLDMQGSKTPGELAFLLPGGDTVVCGDLVRGQRAGHLTPSCVTSPPPWPRSGRWPPCRSWTPCWWAMAGRCSVAAGRSWPNCSRA